MGRERIEPNQTHEAELVSHAPNTHAALSTVRAHNLRAARFDSSRALRARQVMRLLATGFILVDSLSQPLRNRFV